MHLQSPIKPSFINVFILASLLINVLNSVDPKIYQNDDDYVPNFETYGVAENSKPIESENDDNIPLEMSQEAEKVFKTLLASLKLTTAKSGFNLNSSSKLMLGDNFNMSQILGDTEQFNGEEMYNDANSYDYYGEYATELSEERKNAHQLKEIEHIYKSYLVDALLDAMFKKVDPVGKPTTRRAFEGALTADSFLVTLDKIANYGCHCMFGSNWKKGRGKPLNGVDQTCKDLTNCYKCLNKDHVDEEQIGVCDVETESFSYPSLDEVKAEGVLNSCITANNGDICKTRLCSCDTQFSFNLINLFFAGSKFDELLIHEGPHSEFFEATCKGVGSGIAPKKECCGDYPTRFPYKVESKSCCIGKLYDPSVYNCCSDGLSQNVC